MKLLTAKKSRKGRKKRELIKKVVAYIILSLFGVTMVTPFLWTLSTSLKEPGAMFASSWIPKINFIEREGKKLDVRVEERIVAIQIVETGEIIKGIKSKDITIFSERRWWNPFSRRDYFWEKMEEEAKWEEKEPKKIYVRRLKESVEVAITQEGPYRGEVIKDIPAEEVRTKVRPVWKNYAEAWKAIPFGRGYINSLFVAITITVGQVFTSSMAAYAFARLSFPGRDKLFLGYLGTLMIPRAVIMIPVFILFKKLPEVLNWIFHTEYWSTPRYLGPYLVGNPIGLDSYFALIALGLFSAYGTFMLRQFFMTIPRDLEDAARIDGSSHFGTFFRIILPLSKPALATLTIFTFMGSWRAFLWPLIITNSMQMKTLPVMIASFQGLYSTDWNLLMAASLITLVPVLVVFVIGQRFFVEGIRLGAIKE